MDLYFLLSVKSRLTRHLFEIGMSARLLTGSEACNAIKFSRIHVWVQLRSIDTFNV